MIHLKTPEEIDVIARGGAIIADFLVEVRPRIQPGISTLELDGFMSTTWTEPLVSEARTSVVENMPKANIVAIAAMAMSNASPKDCPILVFIYSYLLVLAYLKRRLLL